MIVSDSPAFANAGATVLHGICSVPHNDVSVDPCVTLTNQSAASTVVKKKKKKKKKINVVNFVGVHVFVFRSWLMLVFCFVVSCFGVPFVFSVLFLLFTVLDIDNNLKVQY
jgi:hypothetical protein